jgi:hypothetical protein
MTLTGKGARAITVEGSRYRWRVRPRPTYSQGLGWSPLSFAVELADDPGTTLLVRLPVAHPGNWLNLPTRAVQPSLVAASIRAAVAAGWIPAQHGPAFLLDMELPATAHDTATD